MWFGVHLDSQGTNTRITSWREKPLIATQRCIVFLSSARLEYLLTSQHNALTDPLLQQHSGTYNSTLIIGARSLLPAELVGDL